MKAIRIHNYGSVEELRLEEVPDPTPAADEVLVKLIATSVNPVDFKIRSGAAKSRFPQQFPAILGRDLVGIVEKVGGPGGAAFAVGDRVMGLVFHTYAELVAARAADLCLVPEGLDDQRAAALPLVTTTGAQLVEEQGKVQRGQLVLVTGALGGVGRTAVFVAQQHGAQVIAGVRRSQLEDARRLHVERVVALDDPAAVQALPPLDLLCDTVGGDVAVALLPKLKKGGTLASVVGAPPGAESAGVRIAAFMVHPDAARLRQLAEAVAAGKFSVPVEKVMRFAEIREAHREAERGGHGKLVIVPR